MKKAIAIVLSIMFVFALTAATFAAEKKAATKHAQVTGEVTAVDAKSITVKGKKGDVTAAIDEKTKVSPKGKTAADVKVGDQVTVKYTEADGKNTATSIDIKAAKKAEKKAAPAASPAAPAAPEKKKSAGY